MHTYILKYIIIMLIIFKFITIIMIMICKIIIIHMIMRYNNMYVCVLREIVLKSTQLEIVLKSTLFPAIHVCMCIEGNCDVCMCIGDVCMCIAGMIVNIIILMLINFTSTEQP